MIKFNLETGRTHQIRVHMQHKKTNIIGDNYYGKKIKKLRNVEKNLKI